MEVLAVKTERGGVELASGSRWGSNTVDLLTGPNGSGKTEILTVLTETFRGTKQASNKGLVTWRSDHYVYNSATANIKLRGPARLIAQTFSPFSRFPRPGNSDVSLTSIYSDGMSQDSGYVCIGMHKSTRFVGSSLSKRTLEQAIHRFSEALEGTEIISEVMGNLGFENSFEFTYEPRPFLRELINNYGDISLDFLLVRLEERRHRSSMAAISAELRRTDAGHLAELLKVAINLLGPEIMNSGGYTHHFGSSQYRGSLDYAVLQSLSLLRRLDLLTLKSCFLTARSGNKIDVANASSGQQQMLCSVIGLVTALKDNSLVLIDEPELSLHPRWQQLYIDYLRIALNPFSDCHVVIATHSPLIVQRGLVLKAGVVQIGQESVSSNMDEQSQSVESTLMNVFDTPILGSTYLANQIFSAISDAEAGDEEARENSLKQLNRLKELYSDPQFGDQKTHDLIEEAVALLHISEESDA